METFKDLKPGQCFYTMDDSLFVKIRPVYLRFSPHKGVFNATCIYNTKDNTQAGNLWYISPNAFIHH